MTVTETADKYISPVVRRASTAGSDASSFSLTSTWIAPCGPSGMTESAYQRAVVENGF